MNKEVNVGIIGTGYYVPEKIVTNDDLSKIVDTNDEWIVDRTGIKERRIAADNQATSDLAYEAALKALANANVQPEEIDLIITATITPDTFFPSTACIIQNRLKAVNAAAFDLSSACSGQVYALVTAQNFIATGMYKKALVIGAELFNTSIEEVVNLLSPEIRIHAKYAKDIAAGAVLVNAFFAAVVGCIILIPKIISLF